jgi:type IV pilus assembly protein PilA
MSRSRLAASDGFTLVEILVVILIVGILAAIALPIFLNQRDKAQDAEAKTAVATAAKAIETWGTEHDSSYDGATTAALARIEPSLGQARNLSVDAQPDGYTVSVDSAGDGGTFSIARAGDGSVVRDCTQPGRGTCRSDADEHGDRW